MKSYFTTELEKKVKKLKHKKPHLYAKIQSKLRYFEENHKHISLQTHKLKGKLGEAWSISIERNFRMLYYIKDGWAIFFDLGTHDEVYKQ